MIDVLKKLGFVVLAGIGLTIATVLGIGIIIGCLVGVLFLFKFAYEIGGEFGIFVSLLFISFSISSWYQLRHYSWEDIKEMITNFEIRRIK